MRETESYVKKNPDLLIGALLLDWHLGQKNIDTNDQSSGGSKDHKSEY